MKKLILISAVILSVSLVASGVMATPTATAITCQPVQKAKPAVPGVSPALMDDTQAYTPASRLAMTDTPAPTPAGGGMAAAMPAKSASSSTETGGRTLLMGEYWKTFYHNYKTVGIDQTAILAIKEGIQPTALMEGGVALEDLNPQNLIKAMYCAGYKGDDIKKASDQLNISELVLVAGFKKSQEECRDQVTDTQAYTAVAAPTMAGTPSPASGGFSYSTLSASPATF